MVLKGEPVCAKDKTFISGQLRKYFSFLKSVIEHFVEKLYITEVIDFEIGVAFLNPTRLLYRQSRI